MKNHTDEAPAGAGRTPVANTSGVGAEGASGRLATGRTGPSEARPRGVAARLASTLRQAVADGVYSPGDRLPAERQLAQDLHGSRGTVRKALDLLEQDGIIERRVGSGTFVLTGPRIADEDIAENVSPIELIQARNALEPAILMLAIRNATQRDIAAIGEALGQLDRAGADREVFTFWDQRFHLRIAEASHNPLMVLLYRQINHVRGHRQWRVVKDKVLTSQRIADYNRQHRAIYDAIRTRNQAAIERLLKDHLAAAELDLLHV
ncbi:MAG: FadR/GntR family transcriptional regulator [Alphaproteobacteria bacterium]